MFSWTLVVYRNSHLEHVENSIYEHAGSESSKWFSWVCTTGSWNCLCSSDKWRLSSSIELCWMSVSVKCEVLHVPLKGSAATCTSSEWRSLIPTRPLPPPERRLFIHLHQELQTEALTSRARFCWKLLVGVKCSIRSRGWGECLSGWNCHL